MRLRKFFGLDQEEVWQRFAQEAGGEFTPSGWWTGEKVTATVGGWPVTLDTYTVMAGKVPVQYTRMMARVRAGGFHFRVYRKTVLSNLGKWFGMQDVEIGPAEFDDAFIVKTNDEARVRELLGDLEVRMELTRQKDVDLRLDEEGLHYEVSEVITDLERLRALHRLFAEVLHRLEEMGVAERVAG